MKTVFSAFFKKASSKRGKKAFGLGSNAHNAKLGHLQGAFTLIEVLIAVAIALILALIIIGGLTSDFSQISTGVGGAVETRCIGGYQFAVGVEGAPEQILNEEGKGIPCNRR